MATSGNPPPPAYDFYYWHHDGSNSPPDTLSSSLTPPSYTVQKLGNFSASCVVTYAHHAYKKCYATCYTNITATVFGEYNILLTFGKVV